MLIDTIDLQTWIPSVVSLFEDRIHARHQQIYVVGLAALPPLTTDLSDLKRILIELLTNACTYTPSGELIIVSTYASTGTTQLSVSSSGVEVAAMEDAHAFETLYRIPKSDPWHHIGAGLGLAIVTKLVHRLGATLEMKSGSGQTTVTIKFPTEGEDFGLSDREQVVLVPIRLR